MGRKKCTSDVSGSSGSCCPPLPLPLTQHTHREDFWLSWLSFSHKLAKMLSVCVDVCLEVNQGGRNRKGHDTLESFFWKKTFKSVSCHTGKSHQNFLVNNGRRHWQWQRVFSYLLLAAANNYIDATRKCKRHSIRTRPRSGVHTSLLREL